MRTRVPKAKKIKPQAYSLTPEQIKYVSKKAFDARISASQWMRQLVDKAMGVAA